MCLKTADSSVRGGKMGNAGTLTQQGILSQLADTWSTVEIRSLATSLLRIADSIDQNWDPSNVHSAFRWPNELARIEKNAVNLAAKAQLIYNRRTRRKEFIPAQILGEPAWDMLLDLFMQYAGGAKVSTSSLCIASGVASSTALRHISALEAVQLIKRSESAFDRRVTFLSLSDAGILAMGRYLEKC